MRFFLLKASWKANKDTSAIYSILNMITMVDWLLFAGVEMVGSSARLIYLRTFAYLYMPIKTQNIADTPSHRPTAEPIDPNGQVGFSLNPRAAKHHLLRNLSR
jgi:hypothetical protein